MAVEVRLGKEVSGLLCSPAQERLYPFLRDLLNREFNSVDDLSRTQSLLAILQLELDRDHEEFRNVQARVLGAIARGVSYYDLLARSLHILAWEIEKIRTSSLPCLTDEDRSCVSGVAPDASQIFASEGVSPWENIECSDTESIMSPKVAENKTDDLAFNRRAMVDELEALASEVARVEKVRIYAESVLKLEQLVGDLEASVAVIASSGRSIAQIGGSATSLRIMRAVRTMQATESAVTEIVHAHWNSLVSAVDLRVDRVAAILRPAAIADHRGLLTTIGWPPPLSAAAAGGDKLANPFLEMPEEQERKYCQSFMALAILQAVQQGRRARQLNEHKVPFPEIASPSETGSWSHLVSGDGKSRSSSTREPLWAVEELVSSVASKTEPHFVRWVTKPELVFALAYRIAQEYVDVIDDFLQPLIDKARLVGYSAREEWIFSVVGMVSVYLQVHVLPGLANDLLDDGGAGSVGAALWLHIVDQAIAFDSRMKSLASRALGLFQEGSLEESQDQDIETLSGPVTLSISAIAERSEWLALWAKLEFEDVLEKLKAVLQTDVAWVLKSKPSPLFDFVEEGFHGVNGSYVARIGEFRPPPGADALLSSMSAVTDRCRNLSEPDQQYRFIKDAVIPLAEEYLQELMRRCQESEATTALAEEGSMVKVSTCVNAARYCEHVLQDWGEDILFLGLLQMRQDPEEGLLGLEGSIFDEKLEKFKQFREEWLGKLVSSISRGFEARCRDYLRNKKRWTEVGKGILDLESYSKVSEIGDSEKASVRQSDILDECNVIILKDFDVSASLVDALAMLQSQLRGLRATLDDVNFLELWRNLAVALDQLLINSVVFSGTKFSERGGWQFAADIQALFMVFKPYCSRPSGFFKTVHDAAKLLTLPYQEALSILQILSSSATKFREPTDVQLDKNKELLDSLRQYGVRKLPPSAVKRILSSRMLPGL